MDKSRDDILAAIVAERVTTMLTTKKKGKPNKKFTVEDFIPKWGKRAAGATKRQTPEQQKNLLKALTSKFGGSGG